MRTSIAVTMAAALMAAPAMAQDQRPTMTPMTHAQGGMMEMMMGGMMAMTDSPDLILKLRESLELSESQVQRVKAIQESAHSGMQQHMMPAMQGMQAAMKLLEAPAPDFAAYEAELRKAANHMVLAHSAMARADADARQVLTAPQRERLAFARKIMAEMKDGMMKDSMMKPPKDGMMQ